MADEVWLLRHAETEWSRDGKHTGRSDIPLTDEGREAARRLGERLADVHFALVLCSPLSRARETAQLARLECSGVRDDLLEWDYGDDEGRTSEDIREERPGWSIWSDGPKNGEPIAHVAVRAERVIDRALGAGGDVLAFAHGHIFRVLASRWIELPAAGGARLALGAGTVCVLGYERETQVIRLWNEPPR